MSRWKLPAFLPDLSISQWANFHFIIDLDSVQQQRKKFLVSEMSGICGEAFVVLAPLTATAQTVIYGRNGLAGQGSDVSEVHFYPASEASGPVKVRIFLGFRVCCCSSDWFFFLFRFPFFISSCSMQLFIVISVTQPRWTRQRRFLWFWANRPESGVPKVVPTKRAYA